MLALLVMFAVLVTGGGARADDGAHAHHNGQVQAEAPQAHDQQAHDRHQPPAPASAAQDTCHCMFTGCVPVLPVTTISLTVSEIPFRHPMPPALIAWAGLGSEPPSEPPRS